VECETFSNRIQKFTSHKNFAHDPEFARTFSIQEIIMQPLEKPWCSTGREPLL